MTDLDNAREWAEEYKSIDHLAPRVNAAIDIILSLPDQWVDVEKVREIIESKEGRPPATALPELLYDLRNLLTPKLPTLAELIKQGNDPEQYRWTQAKVFHTEELGCITNFDLYGECATVLFPNGVAKSVPYEDITPLPDLPKLEWPGEIPRKPYLFGGTSSESDLPDMSVSERMERTENSIKPEDVPAGEEWIVLWRGSRSIGVRYADSEYAPWRVKRVDGVDYYNASDSEITLVEALDTENVDEPETTDSNSTDIPKQPSEVPPNEPWLIEANGTKAIGTRYKGDAVLPWFVAALDGSFADDYHDSVVTLIHKLVPEPPALPEGMRLADERTLGRVMVTTEFDSERTCEIIYWNNALGRNCPGFADESDLTFLDGVN